MDKKVILAPIIAIIIIFVVLFLITPQGIGPGTPSQDVIQNAWIYCGQFNSTDCNSNKFLDTSQYPAPINCYWNTKTNNCDAGIGYQ